MQINSTVLQLKGEKKSPTIKRCVGLTFADFEIALNHLVLPTFEFMQTYKL